MFNTASYTRLPVHTWQTVGEYQSYGMAYYVSRGEQPAQAAAILGNLLQESGLDPNAVRLNDGGPGIDSKGIGQWNRTRLAALQIFTMALVGAVPTVQELYYAQLAFVVHELWTTMSHAHVLLIGSIPQDETLAGVFGKVYEGFGDSSVPARNAYAKAALLAYNPADADIKWGA